jgi:hypothetical protein
VRHTILLSLLSLSLLGQQSQQFNAPPPSMVQQVFVTSTGAVGTNTYCYFVVAVYPIGMTTPSNPTCVYNSNGTLSGGNYNSIKWSQNPPGGKPIGYWVIRSTSESFPGSGTVAVNTTVLSPSVFAQNDQTNTLHAFTYVPATWAVAHITLDNLDYGVPVFTTDTPVSVNTVIYATLPLATKSSGLAFLVTDAISSSNCGVGGGTNTPALCWSNGSAWYALGVGGTGSMVYPPAGIPLSVGGTAWGTSYTADAAATPNTVPVRNASSEVIAANTVGTGKTAVDTNSTQAMTGKTVDGVTPTVMGYVDPNSSIQTQLNGKQVTLSNIYPTSFYSSGSATGGLQEAANAIPLYGSGIILITQPITMTAGFVLPVSRNVTIQGPGSGYASISRDASFTGAIFTVTGSVWGLTLKDMDVQLGFDWPGGTTPTGLHAYQCGFGRVFLDNVIFSNGDIGVWDQECWLEGSFTAEMDATAPPQPYAGLYIQSYFDGQELTGGVTLHDVKIFGSETSGYAPQYGIITDGSDGVSINGLAIQATTDIFVNPPPTTYVANWDITHITSDGFTETGIKLAGTGAIINFYVDDGWMNGPLSTSSVYNTALSLGGRISSAAFSNLRLAVSAEGCVSIGPSGTPRSVSLDNITCLDGNQSNNASAIASSGVYIYAGTSGVNLNNLRFYNTSGAGHLKTGVYVAGALTDSVINGLSSNLTTDSATDPAIFWVSPSAATHVVVSNVQDTNNQLNIPLVIISDAATLTWPNWNNFLITGAGTTVTAVTMTNVQAGSSGTFRTTGGAITFSAGGGIGNTITTVQNIPVMWTWDGSSLWLK